VGIILRTYDELIQLRTFDERFNYLKLNGKVAEETFGFDRYINQRFYNSDIWKRTRRDIITRDLGNDLGLDHYEIHGVILIHHMNPINVNDIRNNLDFIINPDYLITTCLNTHNAIHYNGKSPNTLKDRFQGDTCPWRS
jgi:hypothetical protein